MEYKILNPNNYKTSEWSGGSTTQFYIYPEDEVYPDGDFQIRVSSARVEHEVCKFTKLNKVKRFLMTLEGSLKIVYEEEAIQYINPYDIISFMGHWDTVSYGKAVDFNLMLRNGADGIMNFYNLKKNESMKLNDLDKEYDKIFIYIIKGIASFKDKKMHQHQSIIIEKIKGDLCDIFNNYDEDLKIVVCKITHN